MISDLVEADILYFALFPTHAENILNGEYLDKAPNRLAELLPAAADWQHVIRVIDPARTNEGSCVCVNANPMTQKVVCYIEPDSDLPR